MSWKFGRIDLARTNYTSDLEWQLLEPVPVLAVQQVYHSYCTHKKFESVMPLLPGRLTRAGTEIIGYHDQGQLVAWSMYQIWDDKNILSDHFAWDYSNPQLRLGIRSLKNECAIYRDRGYQWMYFESVKPYMLAMQGFETLGPVSLLPTNL